MNRDGELERSGADLSAMIGLKPSRIILSRYQLDFYFDDDNDDQAAIVTLENVISLTIESQTYVYNIQQCEGIFPFNKILGNRIDEIAYDEGASLTIRFHDGSVFNSYCSAKGHESGAIRVSRGATKFLLPLL
jgi:hypothetical protein